MADSAQNLAWWQRGVIYQIWVRSFHDTNGDVNGDLAGLAAKLDYLQWLGVDALWLSPIYLSPLIEAGYDVEDYTAIHPLYGSLEEFDGLVSAAHERGMKVILDFVPSHTSDAHPWFQESRSSRDNPKREWYIWADPKEDGSPPNNWVGCFGGNAWTYDKETGQYYEHAFLSQQPDLNWRNPEVQQAIFDAMRFWLGRGVDGFRMDAIWHIIKDDQLRDNPPNPDYTPALPPDNALIAEYTRNHPEVHDVIRAMRDVVDEFDERMLGGELYMGVEEMMVYYGSPDGPELHMPFNLQLSVLPWDAAALGNFIDEYMNALPEGAWPNWVISTHDSSRIASRAGERGALLAAMMLLTLPGTPTIYYGDEIGMLSVEIPRDEIEDPRELLTPYLGLGRDPSRTPMRWNGEPNADFTSGDPWLPVSEDAPQINVNVQSEDPCSTLTLYRRLIALHREAPALLNGGFRMVEKNDNLIVFERTADGQRWLIALNFGGDPQQIGLEGEDSRGRLILSTYLDREGDEMAGEVTLRPEEGLILEVVSG